MPKTPQVIVTFSPSGQLQAEIPGASGSRCIISLPPDQCHAALCRILRGQALASAQEAWAIMQASRTHKPYEDQLDALADRKYKAIAAKRHYQLVESQTGLLPKVKTTRKAKIYDSPALRAAFADL